MYIPIIYIVTTLMAMATRLTPLGVELDTGSYRWLDFKVFTFQPSEVCKITLILALATFFSCLLYTSTPEVSAVRDADRIIGLLEANEIGKTELVVNRLRADMVKRGDMMSSDDVVEILAVDLLGVVPDDENIVVSTNQGDVYKRQ